MAFCENCGAKVPDDGFFCESCGAKINPVQGAYKEDAGAAGQAPAQGTPQQYTPQQSAQQMQYQAQQQYTPQNQQYAPRQTAPLNVPPRPQAQPQYTPEPPAPKKSGVPKIAIIIGAVVVLAVAAIIVVPKLKKPGGGSGVIDQIAEGYNDATGKSGGASSNLKIPEGADIKKDAGFTDFIGEYEGEIQLTVLDGFEKIDGVPASYKDERKRVLSEPIGCEFEIEDNGHWDLDIDFMAGMDWDTRDYDDDVDPSELDALMITMPQNGQFHAKMNLTDEVDGKKVEAHMDNIGAYCEQGDKKLIAGNFRMATKMNGADIVMQGDYVVYKTSEEYYKPETAAAETEEETTEEETFPEFETEAETESSSDISQGMREIPTVTGGSWTKMGSGSWVYEKDGRMVKDSWVEDKGVYYYVDEDGYMLTDGITPDGYYVGPDGAYDPNAQGNQHSGSASAGSSGGSGSGSSSGSGNLDLAAIGMALSTEKNAAATEFDWFLDLVGGTNYGFSVVVTDPARASEFKDYTGFNGGWKAFSKSADDAEGTERYFNANISSDGSKFNITMNWKYLWIASSGESVDETASDLFKGTYDKNSGIASADASYGRVVLDHFYVSKNGNAQYATGKFYWISGEVDDLALMRFKDN